MLLCCLLALSLVSYPTSAQPAEPSVNRTHGPLLSPNGSKGSGLDAGKLGSTIGGASGAAMAVITVVLAFAMLRWSRRRRCLYHNRELEEFVSSLQYKKHNTDAESDLQLPAPALLRSPSRKIGTVAMHETHPEEPPSYSLLIPAGAQPSSPHHSPP